MSASSREGLKGTDYIFEEPPAWAVGPLRPWAMDLTYNEVHAMELGLVGLLAGAGWWMGYHEAVATFTVAVIGIAFGLKRLPNVSVASRVLRKEPWYFSTVFIVSALLSVGILEVMA